MLAYPNAGGTAMKLSDAGKLVKEAGQKFLDEERRTLGGRSAGW